MSEFFTGIKNPYYSSVFGRLSIKSENTGPAGPIGPAGPSGGPSGPQGPTGVQDLFQTLTIGNNASGSSILNLSSIDNTTSLLVSATNDGPTVPTLELKSLNNTTGGVVQRFTKVNSAPFGSSEVGNIQYHGTNTLGNLLEVAKKQMVLTDPTSGTEDAEERHWYIENGDISSVAFNLSRKGIGNTCGNLGFNNSINGDATYTANGTGKFKVFSATSGTYTQPLLSVQSNKTTQDGPYIDIYANKASISATDDLGAISFSGNNNSGLNNKIEYGRVQGEIRNKATDGTILFRPLKSGVITTAFEVDGDAIRVPFRLRDALLSAGTTGQVLSSTGSGVSWTNPQKYEPWESNGTLYPTMALGSTTGSALTEYTSSTLYYVRDTTTLVAPTFQGALTGNASSATQVNITNTTASASTFYPVFASSLGLQNLNIDTSSFFNYVPSNDLLTVGILKPNALRDGTNSAGTSGQVLSSTGTGVQWVNPLPAGIISPYAGNTAPAGYLLCDGSPYSTGGVYASLFSVIGYNYGGSGATFNVPNFNGNILIGTTSQTPSLGEQIGTADAYLSNSWKDSHIHVINAMAETTAAASPGADGERGAGDPVTFSAVTHTHSVVIPQHNTNSTIIDLSAIKRSRVFYIIKY